MTQKNDSVLDCMPLTAGIETLGLGNLSDFANPERIALQGSSSVIRVNRSAACSSIALTMFICL